MTDPTIFLSAIAYVKNAIDLTKAARQLDINVASAELKGKLADISEALADAKLSLVDVQEQIAAKDKRIRDLEESFEIKGELIRHGDAYYFKNTEGMASGPAHCIRCWVDSQKLRPLVRSGNALKRSNVCASCGAEYDGHSTMLWPTPT